MGKPLPSACFIDMELIEAYPNSAGLRKKRIKQLFPPSPSSDNVQMKKKNILENKFIPWRIFSSTAEQEWQPV